MMKAHPAQMSLKQAHSRDMDENEAFALGSLVEGLELKGRRRAPTKLELKALFQNCRRDEWETVLDKVIAKPWLAMAEISMDNHIVTTALHQAISSRGDTDKRAKVVLQILKQTPQAAAARNGYGSLPLHVIAQRNTKLKARVKEQLIKALIEANPAALTEKGGAGKRTPMHVIFTDYLAPGLTQFLINEGHQACFMKDSKGWLPVHVACSRHCSPEKLRMLLKANPASLTQRTHANDTLLSLAQESATRTHPNHNLIRAIVSHLEREGVDVKSQQSRKASRKLQPGRVSKKKLLVHKPVSKAAPANDDASSPVVRSSAVERIESWKTRRFVTPNAEPGQAALPAMDVPALPAPPAEWLMPGSRHASLPPRVPVMSQMDYSHASMMPAPMSHAPPPRHQQQHMAEHPANLLLHFSRGAGTITALSPVDEPKGTKEPHDDDVTNMAAV